MRDAPTTRISLLAKLSEDSNEVAWREFVELYEPAIYRFVRRRGLQDADALEVVQEVLLNVQHLAANPPSKPISSFRGWLSQVARHRAIDLVRKRIRLEQVLQSQNALFNSQYNEQHELTADVRHQMFVLAARLHVCRTLIKNAYQMRYHFRSESVS
jgi:RNA polymerase sigma factor (sigma-70 family)